MKRVRRSRLLFLLFAKTAVVWVLLELICGLASSSWSIRQEQLVVSASFILGMCSMFVRSTTPRRVREIRGFEVAVPCEAVAVEAADSR